jgi:hypothetical protein
LLLVNADFLLKLQPLCFYFAYFISVDSSFHFQLSISLLNLLREQACLSLYLLMIFS